MYIYCTCTVTYTYAHNTSKLRIHILVLLYIFGGTWETRDLDVHKALCGTIFESHWCVSRDA